MHYYNKQYLSGFPGGGIYITSPQTDALIFFFEPTLLYFYNKQRANFNLFYFFTLFHQIIIPNGEENSYEISKN
jgi:hypothetical protein